jgi:hypothetical protein
VAHGDAETCGKKGGKTRWKAARGGAARASWRRAREGSEARVEAVSRIEIAGRQGAGGEAGRRQTGRRETGAQVGARAYRRRAARARDGAA